MSIFTNPIAAARDEADAYTAAVLGLLGDHDPLAVLEELPAALDRRLAGLDDDALRRPEAPGRWSLLEVVHHLADSELVWAYRMRCVLADDGAPLTGYDQDRWAVALRYRQAALDDVLALLRALRRANLALLRSLDDAQWQRAGLHSERGRETLADMLRLYAGHDLVHLRQIDRIRAGHGG